jgi:subtilisin family serine protease
MHENGIVTYPTVAIIPSQATKSRRLALLWLLLFLLLFVGAFGLTMEGASSEELPKIEIYGTVVTAPSAPSGQGAWQIRADNQRLYTVLATAATEFKKGIPKPNQAVRLKGTLDTLQQIKAQEIELLTEGGREVRLKGVLLRVPDNAAGIGIWVVQGRANLTYTLLVNSATRLDDGVPSLGSWLEVRGQWQQDNTFLAKRIRSDDHVVNQVIVRLADGVLSTTVASQYGLLPLQTLLASGNIHLMQTNEDQESNVLDQLRADSGKVIWAELNYAGGIPEGSGYKTWHWGGDDPSAYINQGAFAQVNLTGQSPWQGTGVIIAVLDTGVDLAHPALQGRLLTGHDMVDDDAVPNDDGDGVGWGHGTHVTGILAKIAPQSQILPVRVLDTDGRGNLFTLAYAIEWAVAQGADVINLSLGAEGDSRILHDTIQRVLDQGVIVVAAAGNSNTSTPQYPATYPGVIAVTAVDGANQKADFANYGAQWVDMAAPGVGITSTMVGPLGSGYASWSGTSMSAPFVSGAVALLRQALPSASPAEIAERFTSHSQNLDTQNPTYSGQLGGLLNIGATLADDPVVTPTPTSPAPTPTSPAPTPTAPPPTTYRQKLFLPLTRR